MCILCWWRHCFLQEILQGQGNEYPYPQPSNSTHTIPSQSGQHRLTEDLVHKISILENQMYDMRFQQQQHLISDLNLRISNMEKSLPMHQHSLAAPPLWNPPSYYHTNPPWHQHTPRPSWHPPRPVPPPHPHLWQFSNNMPPTHLPPHVHPQTWRETYTPPMDTALRPPPHLQNNNTVIQPTNSNLPPTHKPKHKPQKQKPQKSQSNHTQEIKKAALNKPIKLITEVSEIPADFNTSKTNYEPHLRIISSRKIGDDPLKQPITILYSDALQTTSCTKTRLNQLTRSPERTAASPTTLGHQDESITKSAQKQQPFLATTSRIRRPT